MIRDVGLIGPLNIDLLITGQAPLQAQELVHWAGPSDVQLNVAGSAGYIAQDLAKFGLQTSVVSTLSDDTFGDSILRILDSVGIDTTHVTRQLGTLSGIGIYMLLFGSKKRPLTYRLPTHLPWPKPISQEQRDFLLKEHRHIHCAGYLHFPEMWTGEMAGIFRDAKNKGLSTSLDTQFVLIPVQTPWLEPLIDLLKYTDLLLLDEDEAKNISLEEDLFRAAELLCNKGPKVVVIKCGDRGSVLASGRNIQAYPAVQVPEDKIVDSIGAGDAFDCGMIYGLLQDWSPIQSLKFATLVAASSLRGSGGTESLATVDELMKIIGLHTEKGSFQDSPRT